MHEVLFMYFKDTTETNRCNKLPTGPGRRHRVHLMSSLLMINYLGSSYRRVIAPLSAMCVTRMGAG